MLETNTETKAKNGLKSLIKQKNNPKYNTHFFIRTSKFQVNLDALTYLTNDDKYFDVNTHTFSSTNKQL